MIQSQFTQINASLLESFFFYLALRAASLACDGHKKIVIYHMTVTWLFLVVDEIGQKLDVNHWRHGIDLSKF